jgi:hypothetical protein
MIHLLVILGDFFILCYWANYIEAWGVGARREKKRKIKIQYWYWYQYVLKKWYQVQTRIRNITEEEK